MLARELVEAEKMSELAVDPVERVEKVKLVESVDISLIDEPLLVSETVMVSVDETDDVVTST